MQYYHIKVDYSDPTLKKDLTAYGFDFIDIVEVKDEIVRAFLRQEPFLLDGTRIDGKVRSLKVFESDNPIDICVRLVNQNTPPNIIVYYSKEDILPEENYVFDITKEVVKSVQSAIKNAESSIEKEQKKHLINKQSREVFVVHGHDEAARESVEAFLRSLELKPVVIFEQENKGQTIIEKIEAHANVPYAIILYTPCDLGMAKEDVQLKARARQNVVFEHGYLMGCLGRERITALVKGDLETPGN